jgi:hypothetical protein
MRREFCSLGNQNHIQIPLFAGFLFFPNNQSLFCTILI